jgi:hypothetical protein
MKLSNKLALLAASAALTAACGGGTGADEVWEIQVHVVLEDGAGGQVEVDNAGAPEVPCADDCGYTYGEEAGVVTFTPVADGGSVFVGWSGDCTGTEPLELDEELGVELDCTATFTAATSAGPSREGILVANRQTCTANGASFDCNVPAGGSFNVNAPSATLDPSLLTANEFCYYYIDVSDFSSEDHGVVGLVTSQIDATATWNGGYYNFTGLTGAPFAATDSVAITTSGGTVNVTAPPQPSLLDDATDGLTIETPGTADTIRLLAFGYDAGNNAFGVLCRFPFSASARVSDPDFVSAIATAGTGSFPDFVFAGVSNQEDITGWDDETRVGEAVRWFQLAGPTLEAMGELQ